MVPTSKSRATPGDTKGSRQGLRSIPVLKLAVRSIELSGPGYDGQAPEISILTVVSAESRTDLSPGHVGALLRFTRDLSDTATVVPGNKVKYGEDVVNISDAAKSALKKIGKDWKRVRGPMYWLYNGKTLHELHEKISG